MHQLQQLQHSGLQHSGAPTDQLMLRTAAQQQAQQQKQARAALANCSSGGSRSSNNTPSTPIPSTLTSGPSLSPLQYSMEGMLRGATSSPDPRASMPSTSPSSGCTKLAPLRQQVLAFTCFTGTKVQILTRQQKQEAESTRRQEAPSSRQRQVCVCVCDRERERESACVRACVCKRR
jgi:hypothetical protein